VYHVVLEDAPTMSNTQNKKIPTILTKKKKTVQNN